MTNASLTKKHLKVWHHSIVDTSASKTNENADFNKNNNNAIVKLKNEKSSLRLDLKYRQNILVCVIVQRNIFRHFTIYFWQFSKNVYFSLLLLLLSLLFSWHWHWLWINSKLTFLFLENIFFFQNKVCITDIYRLDVYGLHFPELDSPQPCWFRCWCTSQIVFLIP